MIFYLPMTNVGDGNACMLISVGRAQQKRRKKTHKKKDASDAEQNPSRDRVYKRQFIICL